MHASCRRLLCIFLSVLLLSVITTGCVQPRFPTGQAPAVAPQSYSPAGEIAEMKERSDAWRNFQCKLRIDVNGKTARFSAPAIVLVKAPNFVRFETFTPIGTTAALFVSNQAGPFLLAPSQKTIYSAKRPETLVREFLGGVSLPVDLFSRVLSASISPERMKNIESREEDGLLRLIWRSPGEYIEWQIVSGALTRVFIGGAQFEGQVSYDPPVPLSSASTPRRIRIAAKGWNMDVLVEKMRPVAQFQPGVFRLPALSGMKEVVLDERK